MWEYGGMWENMGGYRVIWGDMEGGCRGIWGDRGLKERTSSCEMLF